jgi:6-phosphofructokinase
MRAAAAHGNVGVVAFIDGFKGVLNGDAIILKPDMVSGIEQEGGVFMGTSRFNPTAEQRAQIIKQLRQWGIQGLNGVGGDDTNTTNARNAKDGLRSIGVPKTIDNDVPGTDITYGHRTVIDASAEQLKALKIDARAQDEVSAYVVSIMGRTSGSWALEAGSAGGATAILIPEQFSVNGIKQIMSLSESIMPRRDQLLLRISRMLEVDGRHFSYDALTDGIKGGAILDQDLKLNATSLAKELAEIMVDRVKADLPFAVFAVAEGIANRLPTKVIERDGQDRPIKYEVLGLGEPVVIGVDAHFNPRFSDINIEYHLQRLLKAETNRLGLKVKLVPRSFGYQFRCMAPCGFDINLASKMGHEAMSLLINGQTGRMVVEKGGGGHKIDSIDYDKLPYDETGHLIPRLVDLTSPAFNLAVSTEHYKRGPAYRESIPPQV